MESSIGWSPDQSLLAATCLLPDERMATVVVDTDGQVLCVLEREGRPFVALNVTDGSTRRPDVDPTLVVSTSNRLWTTSSAPRGTHDMVITTRLDDADPQPSTTSYLHASVAKVDLRRSERS
jgi:hypothetical protein